MTCCTPQITEFTNATSTNVAFGAYERSVYGSKPMVSVLYKEGSQYIVAGIFTQITYSGDVINVDHGGTYSGFVKVE